MPLPRPVLIAVLLGCISSASAAAQALILDAKIPLGDVRGRIDHLALDVSRQRLYVAELGNNSLGVVDLRARRTLSTIRGLSEPQGVGYVPSTDTIWVANGGDGTLRLFRGEKGQPDGVLPLGNDADNVRVDAKANRVYVGYGSGHIAIFDAYARTKLGEIALKAHPEGFQPDASARHLYVNVPDAHQIAVIDLAGERQSETWANEGAAAANFPLALDPDDSRVLVGFRSPATLIAYDMGTGRQWSRVSICGDADDIAWVRERHLAYVSCGEGLIDVIGFSNDHMQRIERVTTARGARTLLFSAELDRIYAAIPASGQVPAAIWVLRPGP